MSDDIEDRGDELPNEPEATQEPTAEPEAPPPAPDPEVPRAQFVPRERFDEVNERLRDERHARMAMEERLRALETPKPPAFDAAKAERDYLEAVAEGDKDKARDLWTQIRTYERRQQEEQLTARVRAELDQHRQQTALEIAAEALTEKYPFLDPNQDAANPAAIAEVVEWRDYYHMAKRMPLHQALKEAVKRVAPAYAKAATPPQGIAGPSGADRTQAQRMANAKASAQLPPSTAQAGIGERANRAAKVDIGKMSDAEFDSLSADERAKLRGDAMA